MITNMFIKYYLSPLPQIFQIIIFYNSTQNSFITYVELKTKLIIVLAKTKIYFPPFTNIFTNSKHSQLLILSKNMSFHDMSLPPLGVRVPNSEPAHLFRQEFWNRFEVGYEKIQFDISEADTDIEDTDCETDSGYDSSQTYPSPKHKKKKRTSALSILNRRREQMQRILYNKPVFDAHYRVGLYGPPDVYRINQVDEPMWPMLLDHIKKIEDPYVHQCLSREECNTEICVYSRRKFGERGVTRPTKKIRHDANAMFRSDGRTVCNDCIHTVARRGSAPEFHSDLVADLYSEKVIERFSLGDPWFPTTHSSESE